MDMLSRLQEDMKAALKAGQKDRLAVIRMLLSDVKNADLQPGKPSAEQVVAAYAKKLRKGIEEYERLGKPDEVAKLRAEVEIAEAYLPTKLSPEATEKLVAEFLAGAAYTEKQAGQAMGAFMKAHGGQVDASIVNGIVRRLLAGR